MKVIARFCFLLARTLFLFLLLFSCPLVFSCPTGLPHLDIRPSTTASHSPSRLLLDTLHLSARLTKSASSPRPRQCPPTVQMPQPYSYYLQPTTTSPSPYRYPPQNITRYPQSTTRLPRYIIYTNQILIIHPNPNARTYNPTPSTTPLYNNLWDLARPPRAPVNSCMKANRERGGCRGCAAAAARDCHKCRSGRVGYRQRRCC